VCSVGVQTGEDVGGYRHKVLVFIYCKYVTLKVPW
jgi:hypothetical protein